MQGLLVKIGKIWSLIERDGFWYSLKRIWGYRKNYFHRVGEGQVLYITGGIGDSALYRGAHIAEELNAHGFVASTTVQDNPFLPLYLDRFEVFVLHRVQCTTSLLAFLAKAEKKGKTVVFETDDLTFDPELFKKTTAYKNMNTFAREQYKDGQSRCLVESSYVKYATTTTEPLAAHIAKAGKEVFVMPNKLSAKDLDDAEHARTHDKVFPDGVTIGYFSGSATHDRDFAQAAPALIAMLEKYNFLQLFIVGALELGKEFDPFLARIHRHPYVPRAQHFVNIAHCDINLAPLEVGDDFCEAKSAIKYLEAGIVGVPTIASATEVFEDAITHGVTGLVASTTQEWREALEKLIQDKELREQIGRAAFEDVLAKHTTHSPCNAAFYKFLRAQLAGSTEEHLEPLYSSNSSIDTAVIIANWNGKEYLETSLKALSRQKDQNFTTIVVDNGSEDGSVEFMSEKYPDVNWISLPENTGFAHPNNVGIQAAFSVPHIRYVITLNNDTDLEPDYIENMRAAAHESAPTVAALQPKVLNFYRKNEIDATGVLTAFEMSAVNRGRGEIDKGQYDDEKEVFGPSASASLYKREALERVRLPRAGFFDKDYFAYYEDVDLAWRLHLAGYKTHYIPDAKVYHIHSATGVNYSPFKAFHIHRNHYYNIIKNVPLPFLIGILLFMPIRYLLQLTSVFIGKGASAAVSQNASGAKKNESLVSIVFRAWKDIVRSLGSLLRKRKYISSRATRRTCMFLAIIKNHNVSLRDVLF